MSVQSFGAENIVLLLKVRENYRFEGTYPPIFEINIGSWTFFTDKFEGTFGSRSLFPWRLPRSKNGRFWAGMRSRTRTRTRKILLNSNSNSLKFFLNSIWTQFKFVEIFDLVKLFESSTVNSSKMISDYLVLYLRKIGIFF